MLRQLTTLTTLSHRVLGGMPWPVLALRERSEERVGRRVPPRDARGAIHQPVVPVLTARTHRSVTLGRHEGQVQVLVSGQAHGNLRHKSRRDGGGTGSRGEVGSD